MVSAFVHPTAEVDEGAVLGEGVRIWHHVHVMRGARIGAGSMLGHAVFVGAGVTIGARCRIQNHVSLFEGLTLEDDVFIGPSAVFTNVKNPRAEVSRRDAFLPTKICQGATVGAGAIILPGLILGRYCFVGAGAVVTRDVPDFCLVLGTPARPSGWMSRRGVQLRFDDAGEASCAESGERYLLVSGRVRLAELVQLPESAKERA
jgi:UDP-2-acetamido-3-amino-2,3-dideoxy-glucuronate N-acetyltransferase